MAETAKIIILKRPQKTVRCRKQADELPRKLINRRKLLAAARKLFTERGYHQTATRDIARLAGVAHGTFYAHFKDKTDCFIAHLSDVEDEVTQVMEWYAPTSKTPAATIRAWISCVLSYSQANPGIVKAALSDIEILSKKYRRRTKMLPSGRRLIALIETWKTTGQAAPDFDSTYFAYLVNGAVRIGDKMVARNPREEKKVVDEMTRFMIRAINAVD